MFEAPFIIKSTEPINKTTAYEETLEKAMERVEDLQSRGSCLEGWIGCYKNQTFVIIKKIDYFRANLSMVLRK